MNTERQTEAFGAASDSMEPLDNITTGRDSEPSETGGSEGDAIDDTGADGAGSLNETKLPVTTPPKLSVVKKKVPEGLLFKKNEFHQIHTDYGNARRMHYKYHADLIHKPDGSWYWWNGKRWALSTETQLLPLVVDMIMDIVDVEIPYYKHLLENGDEDQRKTYWLDEVDDNFIESNYSRAKQSAALKSAAALLLRDTQFDAHRFLLNVDNGVVDLKTGALKLHDRSDHLTKMCQVSYDKDAKCLRWEQVMEHAFPNRSERRYVQKMFGYALTGDVSEKKLFFLWGASGNNGKSTWINVLQGVIGSDFTDTLAITSLAAGNVNKDIRSDLAKLAGKRFVAIAEPDEKFRFNESLIKNFTGGDGIAARHPSQKETTYSPEFTGIVTTNFRPGFRRNDPAIMRRIIIIPCRRSVDSINPNLTSDLLNNETGEKEGILAWLVEGARMWAEDGGMGDCPFDASDACIFVQDVSVEEFINKCCCREPGARSKTMDLFAAYNEYRVRMADSVPESLSIKEFGAVLDALSISAKKYNDGAYRLGIRLVQATAGKAAVDAAPVDEVVTDDSEIAADALPDSSIESAESETLHEH